MTALDLFCGAGGASMGLHQAGFDVTGVDIKPQPNFPFRFIQADAVKIDFAGFDFIWASPPCQRYCMYSRNLGTAKNFPNHIPAVRTKLIQSGKPFVIENVVGAPLENPVLLCGSMFGLKIIRHRLFETNFTVWAPATCNHKGNEIPVYGNGTPQWHRERLGRNIRADEQRDAMEVDWMTRKELTQAIPPAYSRFIAQQFLSSNFHTTECEWKQRIDSASSTMTVEGSPMHGSKKRRRNRNSSKLGSIGSF